MSFFPELFAAPEQGLSEGQQLALRLLNGERSVFLSGGAGTGKSFILKHFLKGLNSDLFPVLASTGAAAVLIKGRTFHSFFSLGILEGGRSAALLRALKDRRLHRRLKKAAGIVIDEISMIPGDVLALAEEIARTVRDTPEPWGGLRVVAVGDFFQLPPITPRSGSARKDWAFLNSVWQDTNFERIELSEVMRSREDQDFCERLAEFRTGQLSSEGRHLLDWRKTGALDEEFAGSVLHARKTDVDRVNQYRLSLLDGEASCFESEFFGDERYRRSLIQNSPINEKIYLKVGALVMLRQNDPKGRWVNGSLGHIQEIEKRNLSIRLLGGSWIDVEPVHFGVQDADGNEVASLKNFPINLAYAVTIHKAQGATLDRCAVSLKGLWEPGQAYVALSRVRSSEDLFVLDWDEDSIFADPEVLNFHSRLA